MCKQSLQSYPALRCAEFLSYEYDFHKTTSLGFFLNRHETPIAQSTLIDMIIAKSDSLFSLLCYNVSDVFVIDVIILIRKKPISI